MFRVFVQHATVDMRAHGIPNGSLPRLQCSGLESEKAQFIVLPVTDRHCLGPEHCRFWQGIREANLSVRDHSNNGCVHAVGHASACGSDHFGWPATFRHGIVRCLRSGDAETDDEYCTVAWRHVAGRQPEGCFMILSPRAKVKIISVA